jgi:HK97 family phage prohead protease
MINKETRFITADVKVEKRMHDDQVVDFGVVEGYAAKFNQITVIDGYFKEVILPGFFDDVLNDDVRCLKNHDPNFILSRSINGAGTLNLTVDEIGLKYSYETPNITYAKDLQQSIELGDVSQSSFSFIAKNENWQVSDGEMDVRELIKCDRLFDVSPVTFPAYADTTVAKRSLENYKEKNKNTDLNIRNKNTMSAQEARHILIVNKSL